jgi:hypothetical protein
MGGWLMAGWLTRLERIADEADPARSQLAPEVASTPHHSGTRNRCGTQDR